ncbi:MAG: sigma-70 family RNA polymerase sigma factor [Oscillospiraceae bacterium]
MQKISDIEQLILLSDEQLAELCKKNENAASVLISRYAKFIWKKAHANTTASAETDDLFQEGLMGLFSAIGSFDARRGTKFLTYANVCITNKMTTALIKSSQSNKPDDLNIINFENDLNSDTPESILLEREQITELFLEINSLLSEKEWKIFRLYLTGSTYDQMARQLNLSPKVVDNALQRVRRKLKSVWRADNFKLRQSFGLF